MAKRKTVEDNHPSFEGRTVAASAVRITRTGDGLSEAMALDPVELHHDDEVWFIIKGRVDQVNYRPIPKAEGLLQRVHTVVAAESAMVDAEDVKAIMDRERERVLLLKEEAQGVTRLPMGDDPLGVLLKAPDEATSPEPGAE